MSERYEVVSTGDGYAILMDREEGTPVMTGRGEIYTAPMENVQWTAVTMNKHMAKRMESPVLADSMMTPEDQERARQLETDPESEPENNLADWEKDVIAGSQPVRPNPLALLHVAILHATPADTPEPVQEPAPEPRHAAPGPDPVQEYMAFADGLHRGQSDPVEEYRVYADKRVEAANDRALNLAYKLGTLEGDVEGIRSMVVGILGALGGLPDSYVDLKATFAVEKIQELKTRLDTLTDSFRR